MYREENRYNGESARVKEKVGILVGTFEPQVGIAAGGHVHFIEVARRWTDVALTIFAPASARLPVSAELPHARFVEIPGIATGVPQIDQLSRIIGAFFVRGELREVDAMLCTSHFAADVVPAVLGRPSRTVVMIHHFIEPPWRRRGNFLANVVSWLAQGTALLIAKTFVKRYIFVSEDTAAASSWATGRAERFLSTNGVSYTGPTHDSSVRSDGIYVGRIVPTKRVEDAIRAWSLLPHSCAGHGLHIVGTGPREYIAELEKLVAEHGLGGRVHFHGRVDEWEKWHLLESAALFVFPSAEEGWGIVLAEAMRAGLPCVTYDLPVFRNVFTKGRRVAPLADVPGLAQQCAAILGDDAERSRVSKEARDFSVVFDWDRAALEERRALFFRDSTRT